MKTRELAKFFAGAFTWDTVTHLAHYISDATPYTLLGVTVTPAMNAAGMYVAGAIAVLLAWYGWFTGGERSLRR